MKMFGDTKAVWWGSHDGNNHVLVAVRGGGWHYFCSAEPEDYETVEPEPKSSPEPIVWLHDREQVTCPFCIALLDGKEIVRQKIDLEEVYAQQAKLTWRDIAGAKS